MLACPRTDTEPSSLSSRCRGSVGVDRQATGDAQRLRSSLPPERGTLGFDRSVSHHQSHTHTHGQGKQINYDSQIMYARSSLRWCCWCWLCELVCGAVFQTRKVPRFSVRQIMLVAVGMASRDLRPRAATQSTRRVFPLKISQMRVVVYCARSSPLVAARLRCAAHVNDFRAERLCDQIRPSV